MQTALDICRKIIAERWNGRYFSAGPARLNQFWIRDFGWSVEGLLFAGYKAEVRKNLEWALKIYQRRQKITTTIFLFDITFDVYDFSCDSLAWLLYIIKKSGNEDLIDQYLEFLNQEIAKYFARIYNPNTALIKSDHYFSQPKDVVRRKFTTVANAFMIFTAQQIAQFPQLNNPFKDLDLVTPFVKTFWKQKYFVNDLQDKEEIISADANLWPYWLGIIQDKNMQKASMDTIKNLNLDKPFPLKYHQKHTPEWMHISARLTLPNYQGDSIWSLNAPMYIEMEQEFYPDAARIHYQKYLELIEKYQTYYEVFEPDGKSYLKGRLGFESEPSMLWASMMLPLAEKFS